MAKLETVPILTSDKEAINVSFMDPQCKHEEKGHKLAAQRTRLASESHIAELIADWSAYRRLRDAIGDIDDAMSVNLYNHRRECT